MYQSSDREKIEMKMLLWRETGRKNRAPKVPLVVPYKALENFSKALYRTTTGTCSVRFFRALKLDQKLSE